MALNLELFPSISVFTIFKTIVIFQAPLFEITTFVFFSHFLLSQLQVS